MTGIAPGASPTKNSRGLKAGASSKDVAGSLRSSKQPSLTSKPPTGASGAQGAEGALNEPEEVRELQLDDSYEDDDYQIYFDK